MNNLKNLCKGLMVVVSFSLQASLCSSNQTLNANGDEQKSYVDNLDIRSIFRTSTNLPDGINPINNFELEKYLGLWYEIGRIDNSFEKGLYNVTAEYSLKDKGKYIEVKNSGVSTKKNKTRMSIGKACFVSKDEQNIGHLKVSFFGPFYSSYIIFHLEPDYSVSLVCGSSRDYCWLLSRNKTLTEDELTKYQEIIKANGFDLDKFVYTQKV
jgi:apolipoprotein D and lipocalin family protein